MTTQRTTRTAEPRNRRLGLRLRLFAWAMGLLVLAVVVSIVVVRQVLLTQVDNRITADLRQEASEFVKLVDGRNPVTGQPFGGDLIALADTYLARNVPHRHEMVLILLGDAVYRGTPDPPYDLSRDGAVVREWTNATQPHYGADETPQGPARWLVVPIVVNGDVRGHFVVSLFASAERAEIAAALRWMALTCLLVLVLAAAGGYLAMGRALRPLRTVTQTAHEIEEDDLSRRIDVTGTDEVADLATKFNSMLDRLERAFATQRAFLSDAGHELRTPITIIRGHLEVMGDDPVDRAETLALVTDELARMSRLVDELLLLARSEQPDFLQPETVDTAALLQEVHAKTVALGDRNWQLGPTSQVELTGDRQRLTQALMQLAHNAARHTVPGDRIRFSAHTTQGRVALSVEDTGPGIAPGDQERIFERFVRVDGARSEGTGLGLSIVKAIAEAHRGTVTVTSTPGFGATFTITLPLGTR